MAKTHRGGSRRVALEVKGVKETEIRIVILCAPAARRRRIEMISDKRLPGGSSIY